jgi:hypothetical protein
LFRGGFLGGFLYWSINGVFGDWDLSGYGFWLVWHFDLGFGCLWVLKSENAKVFPIEEYVRYFFSS